MDILVLNKIDGYENDFEELKKHFDGLVDTILFQDESMIRDYQAIQKFIKNITKMIDRLCVKV